MKQERLNISYSTWSNIRDQSLQWGLFYHTKGEGYQIYTGHKDYAFVSGAFDADATDFENNYKDEGILVTTPDDAYAYLIGITTPSQSMDLEGHLIVSPTHMSISENWREDGTDSLYECFPSGISIYDREINTEVLIDGADWFIENGHLGDTLSWAIVDKNDILGYHTALGYPIGTPIELIRYVKNRNIQPGKSSGGVHPPTVAPVVSGLFIRCIYDNVGEDTTWAGINYDWYEKI